MKIGRLAENIWKRSVRKNIKSNTISTVGIRTTTIPFSGRMGAIAVYDIVNSTLVMSDDIEGVILSLYIDGRCSEDYVQHIVKDADSIAGNLGVKILGFDVHVVQGLKKPFITGYARCFSCRQTGKPGYDEDIVVIGSIAKAGTAMISDDRFDELLNRFSESYINKAKAIINDLSVQKALEIINGFDISYVAALSEGGINATLWEMADIGKIGLTVNLRDILISQEAVEVCNYFDINPYELLSSGAILVTLSTGAELVEACLDNGIEAAIIGKINKSNDKLIINEDEKRFLTIPATDGIYEIT